MTTTTDFAVFANGTFWGVFNAATADEAAQDAADEHGTDGDTNGLYALPAGQSILAAKRDAAENAVDLTDAIRECFNCREADIDDDGNVWIAKPQAGHWLRTDEMTALISFIVR
jgi:hypothetical protein